MLDKPRQMILQCASLLRNQKIPLFISVFGSSGGKKSGAQRTSGFLMVLALTAGLCGQRHLSSRAGRGCRLKADNISCCKKEAFMFFS